MPADDALRALTSQATARRVYALAHQLDPDDLEPGDQDAIDDIVTLLTQIAGEVAAAAFAPTPAATDGPVETPHHVTAGFEMLAEAIGTARGDWSYGNGNITANYGAEPYENPVFALRSFCWCDGEEHAGADCPPNFEHKSTGITATWYKHARRGARISAPVPLDLWRRIEADCLESLGVTLDAIDARRQSETAQCLDCAKTRAYFTRGDMVSVRLGGRCEACRERLYREFEEELGLGEGVDPGAK